MGQQLTTLADAKATCVRSLEIMADGSLADFEAVVHPEAVNLEAAGPSAGRGQGPEAFHAIALWLREAFTGLRWEVRETAAESDLVAVHSTWSGRHVRPFVTYDDAGAVAQAMPPTNKVFAATQSHWFRLADSKIIEHWANRDDLAMGQQLGWIPPSPGYLLRMALANHRARRAADTG
jgi:predicted ester cyclase